MWDIFEAYKTVLRLRINHPPEINSKPQDWSKSWSEDELRLFSDKWAKSVKFLGPFATWATGRVFGVTKYHRIGMFPRTILPGDLVCAFVEGETPFVIRQHVSDIYRLVGECYVHQIMDGELAQMPDLEEKLEDISLQ